MPRGKNYVNQHKGMALKAASKEAVKELCFYGNACQRKDCIYRHEKSTSSSSTAASSTVKSSDPCMAYLSGFCSFTAKTCRKRHPTSDAEVEALLRKYSTIPCRFGLHCKTKGCLYQHPDDENVTAVVPPPNLPTAYPLLHLPQPYGPGVRKPNNSKALRRSLMDPNAFPPLGGDAAAATDETTNHSAPPVCLPAVNNTHVTTIATTPAHPYTYPTYAPNQHAPMQQPPPMGYHYQQQHYDNAPPMAAATMSSTAAAAVPITSLESSTSSASWNLKAQEFVPRGLI